MGPLLTRRERIDAVRVCCRWEDVAVPATRARALRLVNHADGLLEDVEVDPERYLTLQRCRTCRHHWVLDCISSGHAELFFVYPLRAEDPVAAFARVQPLGV